MPVHTIRECLLKSIYVRAQGHLTGENKVASLMKALKVRVRLTGSHCGGCGHQRPQSISALVTAEDKMLPLGPTAPPPGRALHTHRPERGRHVSLNECWSCVELYSPDVQAGKSNTKIRASELRVTRGLWRPSTLPSFCRAQSKPRVEAEATF